MAISAPDPSAVVSKTENLSELPANESSNITRPTASESCPHPAPTPAIPLSPLSDQAQTPSSPLSSPPQYQLSVQPESLRPEMDQQPQESYFSTQLQPQQQHTQHHAQEPVLQPSVQPTQQHGVPSPHQVYQQPQQSTYEQQPHMQHYQQAKPIAMSTITQSQPEYPPAMASQTPTMQQSQQPHQWSTPVRVQSQFMTATPIAGLNRAPAPVDCPRCMQRALTTINFEVGNTTHGWAALACFCALLGCIPYMISSFKDVTHRCGSCGTLLATWHRSGQVEVHAY